MIHFKSENCKGNTVLQAVRDSFEYVPSKNIEYFLKTF